MRLILRTVRRAVATSIAFALARAVAAQDAPPVARYVPPGPDPAHVFVLDSAHILAPATIAALQDSARALQAATGADVAWVTLPTLGGRPIEEAALYIGRSWRIGNAGQPGDPLRNRGLVMLFIPDKTKTAGPNFRVEVGNGLEGTITDSRSRSISNAMRNDLRAKRYDAAYLAGWSVAASLVREDFASHGAAAPPVPARPPLRQRSPPPAVGMSPNPGVLIAIIIIFVILLYLAMRRARGFVGGSPTIPRTSYDDDDDQRRRNAAWLSTSASDPGMGSSGGDSGGSSSSGDSGGGGGSFGDGGGFSGGGSSDTI